MYDVIIVGGGPAGYSCALYSKRFNLNVLVIAKERGGLVTKTHLLENWPAEKSITGFELMQKQEDQITSLGVEIIDDEVLEIKKENDTFIFDLSDKKLEAKAVVIAAGTIRRKLNVPGEDKFFGKGVSYCVTCDGGFFKNKITALVGGSDSAIKEAVYLSEIASKVYIIYRKEYPRADDFNLKLIGAKIKDNKIELVTNSNIVEITGDKKVTGVVLDTKKEIILDGVFVEIGADPNNYLAKSLGVSLNEKGEIKVDKLGCTNVSGVFSAGDVTDNSFKQAITASAEGVMCAKSCYDYLKGK